jgi:invasion protein IalB
MSRLRPFFLALLLASTPVTGGKAIAKQQLGGLGSARKGVPPPARLTVTQPAAAALAAELPNGASSISESYGNWVVECRLVDKQKQCRLLQVQSNSQNNQRVLQVEFGVPTDGKMEGTILLPFGLKLDSGVGLKLDDKELGRGLRFLTCVPAGCLVPLSFATIAVDAMKTGKMLAITSLNLGDQAVTFNVPLDGFAEAIARIVELAKWTPTNASMIQGNGE